MNNNYRDLGNVLKEKLYQPKIRQSLLQALPFWISSIITGLVAVLYAKLFVYAESLSVFIFQQYDWSLFIITPACFVLAWWVVKKFEKNAVGSGIPQVMAAIELANPRDNNLVDKLLGIKVIVVKISSSLIMILGGGVIGREGPTVQIAGSIFRMVNQLIPASWPKVSKKNMIMTGAAAGLAAAFNTPLGGIVFAIEELAKSHISNFKTALFTAVILAGLTAQAILGPYLYLGYPDVSNKSDYLIFSVIFVACICGMLGGVMSVVILKILAWKRKFKYSHYQLLYVISAGLLVACISYFFNHGIMGSGKAEISRVLFTQDKHVPFAMPFSRMVGSVLSFTSGAAGGVFAPSLGIGATVGAYIAELFRFSGPNANILILSGMVAFLTGVTRSPFTSAILVVEMTDRHSVVFYLMMAGLAASLFATLIDKDSFYDHLKEIYLKDIFNEEKLAADTVSIPGAPPVVTD
jgi:H+/Cl- antiporter ClcA